MIFNFKIFDFKRVAFDAKELRRLGSLAQSVFVHFSEDRILTIAGGVTFFILLAIFPAFAALVSLYGFLADKQSIGNELHLFSRFLPSGGVTVLSRDLHRLIGAKQGATGLGFAVSAVVALWSASGGIKGLIEGLNIAFDIAESRSIFKLSGVALLFTVLGILFSAMAINLAVTLPLVLRLVDAGTLFGVIFPIVVWPLAYCFSAAVLAVIYSYGPNWPHPKWRPFTAGNLGAAALWLLGTAIFKWYVLRYGHFDQMYGDLGALVGFLVWIWLSIVIVLTGAELNREIERRRQGSARR